MILHGIRMPMSGDLKIGFKSPQLTLTLPLPPQGGRNFFFISICFPSPLAGEGRVRVGVI
jgi:hypothetical protein